MNRQKLTIYFFIAVTTILSEMYLYKSNAYPPNKNIKLKHQTDTHVHTHDVWWNQISRKNIYSKCISTYIEGLLVIERLLYQNVINKFSFQIFLILILIYCILNFLVENDKSTKKKVDKLGRVRPTVYSHSSEPARKRRVPSTAETSNSASINNKSNLEETDVPPAFDHCWRYEAN